MEETLADTLGYIFAVPEPLGVFFRREKARRAGDADGVLDGAQIGLAVRVMVREAEVLADFISIGQIVP